jgi:hypothetical protein
MMAQINKKVRREDLVKKISGQGVISRHVTFIYVRDRR